MVSAEAPKKRRGRNNCRPSTRQGRLGEIIIFLPLADTPSFVLPGANSIKKIMPPMVAFKNDN
jgi:hypothetical protein